LTSIAAKTLKLKIQLLTRWEEAYNVEQEWWWATRIGEWLDRPYREDGRLWRYFRRHPAMKEAFSWLWWWTKIAAVAVPAMFLAPFWPLAVASYAWTATFAQVFFKKHAHYNKEHRWYQTRQATNLAMNTQERQRLNNVVWWMSRFRRNALYYFWLGNTARDVRQFRDYIQTTQNQLEDTNQVNASIENLINKNVLSSPETINLEDRLAEWLARLDFHRETVRWWVSGQNFLGSNTQATSESEYQKLHRNILAGASRLWISLDDIRNYTRYNLVRTQITEGTWQREWTEEIGYDIAVDRKRSRQREKAIRWALKAGWISFGLSYFASALASNRKGRLSADWNWDPAIHDESLFVAWNVDAPLNTTLSSNPNIAGMDAKITAWVDKLTYVNTTKAAAEMTAKQVSTTAYINANFTWTNQATLLNAINNPSLTSVQSFAATRWADAWNQLLLATRYVEWVEELAKSMVTNGHTATPLWSITFDTVWSVVERSVSWGIWNQAARTMGVTLNYVKEVPTWVWIPAYMNTFGEQLPRGWVNQNRRPRRTR
jgi:glycine cleavage system H lipoate-binding protein